MRLHIVYCGLDEIITNRRFLWLYYRETATGKFMLRQGNGHYIHCRFYNIIDIFHQIYTMCITVSNNSSFSLTSTETRGLEIQGTLLKDLT